MRPAPEHDADAHHGDAHADAEHDAARRHRLRLPGSRSRKHAATAGEVAQAIEAALALDRRSAALCYAIQFETALRQWDGAGQWYPPTEARGGGATNDDGAKGGGAHEEHHD